MGNILNESALNDNRQGRLTISQTIGLVPMMLIGCIFLLMAIFISGGIVYGLISHTFKGSLLAAVIIGGGMSLAFLWLWFVISVKRLIDMLLGKVSRVEGRAIKYSVRGSSSSSGFARYYSVGKEDFQISLGVSWKALSEGEMMRAYYTPFSKTLVNVEPIYSRSSTPQNAQGSFERDEELTGLQRLEQAELEAKKQKKD